MESIGREQCDVIDGESREWLLFTKTAKIIRHINNK